MTMVIIIVILDQVMVVGMRIISMLCFYMLNWLANIYAITLCLCSAAILMTKNDNGNRDCNTGSGDGGGYENNICALFLHA